METLHGLLNPSVTGGFATQMASNAEFWYFMSCKPKELIETNRGVAGILRRRAADVTPLKCIWASSTVLAHYFMQSQPWYWYKSFRVIRYD